MKSYVFAAGALIGACLLASPAPTNAAPVAGAMPKTTLTQSNSNSLVVPVQHYRHHHHGAAAAAAGLFLGAIAAQQEAQRQQGVQYCLQRYRSYDPESGTYLGRDGFCHPCP